MRLQKKLGIVAALLATFSFSAIAEDITVDSALKEYQKGANIAGNMSSIGSDTLNNLMTLWAEAFRGNYPGVNIQIEGKGSSTAPPALIEGTAQLGPMSRKMKPEEIDAFTKKYGFEPVAVGVALDSLAVFVNKDNPVKSLSMPEVDAIFSKGRSGGYANDITQWGTVGVTGDLAKAPMSLFGRNSASGTYGYFKEHALFKGDFKDTVKEQPGSASVVTGVSEDIKAIGYSGIGYKTSGVRAVPLSLKKGGKAFEATYANVLSGDYPLSRLLYVYIAKKPNEPLDPMIKEFLTMVLSKQGQEIVVKDGYLPLPAALAEKQLSMLE